MLRICVDLCFLIAMSRLCPCTSKLPFDRCCGPFLEGKRLPETAAQLMRSRFSAYAMAKIDYLLQTTIQEKRKEENREELLEYCQNASFISLKILETAAGGKNDTEGMVRFHASIQVNGKRTLHSERSTFLREEGRWVYADGV
jgi:SEC-C motif domain protein